MLLVICRNWLTRYRNLSKSGSDYSSAVSLTYRSAQRFNCSEAWQSNSTNLWHSNEDYSNNHLGNHPCQHRLSQATTPPPQWTVAVYGKRAPLWRKLRGQHKLTRKAKLWKRTVGNDKRRTRGLCLSPRALAVVRFPSHSVHRTSGARAVVARYVLRKA